MTLSNHDKFGQVQVEKLNCEMTSSPMSSHQGGFGTDEFNQGVDVPVKLPKPKVEERDAKIPRGNVKAARPRGGGIEQDEGKSRRDYRRA